MMIITDPIRVLRVGSLVATTHSRIEVIFPRARTEFNELFLAIYDAEALIKGLGIVLVGVIYYDA
jgi:hypothetical protein